MRKKTHRLSQVRSASFLKRNKAQEEMVGFALIIVIVAVILIILLGIYLRKPKDQAIESYEESIILFKKLKVMTRIAESTWQKAIIQDQLEEYSKASKKYESASKA